MTTEPTKRTQPTHVLRVEVPLDLSSPPGVSDDGVIRDVTTTLLAISRAAYASYICDDPQVTLDEVKE